MSYKIDIAKKALKFINKQPEEQKRRIFAAIYRLPDQGDRRVMQGEKGLFRLRVGDYRVLYSVDDGRLVVYVIDANNRGDIYKRH